MHSSILRGNDFAITWQGQAVAHADFFADFSVTDRLGILCPAPLDGLEAMTMVMACVTAFYDRYRARGEEFFAYPDFFAFQRGQIRADYAMCDLWPAHKNVAVPEEAQPTLEAIADRAVSFLLVPEISPRPNAFEPATRESARRCLRRAFVYGAADPDLSIACAMSPFRAWGEAVIGSLRDEAARERWQALTADGLTQAFREISVDDALARL